jgi:hypothetical protein
MNPAPASPGVDVAPVLLLVSDLSPPSGGR